MTDEIVKIYCYYYKYSKNLSSFSGGGGPNQNEALGVMTPIHHPRISHLFQGEGDPLRTQGEGGPWWVTLSKKGWGDRDESPKKGVGDRDESPKEGCGGPWWIIQKGRVPRGAPPITIKGRGWGQIMLLRGKVHTLLLLWLDGMTPYTVQCIIDFTEIRFFFVKMKILKKRILLRETSS